ncbi:MAG: hypothetical protein ACJ8AT_36105, partial [Hyalangium sp.]|uniref:hypothetical protein n=1 Tax=Hyalangium sp. TaxID=2028555 RepID=UPI00389B0779
HSSAVSNPKQYIDGVTVHPYGGADGGAGGALGNRDRLINAHVKTGMDVYPTELGWPTALGQSPTGDSQQWSESAQAQNVTNFAAWAETQPWLKGWVYFCYHDFDTKDWYGVVRTDGSHKPAYAALHNAAASSPPPPSGGTMNLDANGVISNIPAGAAKLHVALSATQTGTPSYPGLSAGGDMLAPFPASYRSPDPAKPWVSLQALDSSGAALGAWTTPVQNLPPLPASSGSYTIAAESITPPSVMPPPVQPPAVQSHSHAVSWSKDGAGVVHISVDGTEVGAV